MYVCAFTFEARSFDIPLYLNPLKSHISAVPTSLSSAILPYCHDSAGQCACTRTKLVIAEPHMHCRCARFIMPRSPESWFIPSVLPFLST